MKIQRLQGLEGALQYRSYILDRVSLGREELWLESAQASVRSGLLEVSKLAGNSTGCPAPKGLLSLEAVSGPSVVCTDRLAGGSPDWDDQWGPHRVEKALVLAMKCKSHLWKRGSLGRVSSEDPQKRSP